MYGIGAIKSACSDFDIPIEYGFKKRVAFLKEEIEMEKEHIKELTQLLIDKNQISKEFIFRYLKESNSQITKHKKQILLIKNYKKSDNSNWITTEMIESAKQYPIENLIEVKRGMALCIFHDDHRPSMGIKNNYYHCFACGAKGDTIEFIMKRDALSFTEAVRWLTQ